MSGSKILSANVSTEPSCELAASSSQNCQAAVLLLLVLLRTHCQAAVLLLLLLLRIARRQFYCCLFFSELIARRQFYCCYFFSELPGGSSIAACSSQNSLPGCSSLVCLREEAVTGASLNGREPSQLHVVQLKRRLKCRAATTVEKKQDLVKRLQAVQ